MPHPDATEDDLFGEAFYDLVHGMVPGAPLDRTAQAALTIVKLPAVTLAEQEHRLFMLKTVLGFGPLGPVRGHA